jgi:hypothetical protein
MAGDAVMPDVQFERWGAGGVSPADASTSGSVAFERWGATSNGATTFANQVNLCNDNNALTGYLTEVLVENADNSASWNTLYTNMNGFW